MLDGNCLAERTLQLRVGAQVMLIKNMPWAGLVNGSRGVVVRFQAAERRRDAKGRYKRVSVCARVTRSAKEQRERMVDWQGGGFTVRG